MCDVNGDIMSFVVVYFAATKETKKEKFNHCVIHQIKIIIFKFQTLVMWMFPQLFAQFNS